jgi:hypothetical protein
VTAGTPAKGISEEERKMAVRSSEVGECQICEGHYKIHGSRLVQHGYRRPGTGSTIGSCPGVGRLPYQKSCDALIDYREAMGRQQEALGEWLGRLNRGEVDTLDVVTMRGSWNPPDRKTYSRDTTEPRKWQELVGRERRETEYRKRQLEQESVRCSLRIERWVPREVALVREVEREQAERRSTTLAERKAKHEAKLAHKAALETRKAELEARREAERLDILTTARELAAETSPDPAKILKLHRRIEKTMNWLWAENLHEGRRELTRLGIMREDGFVKAVPGRER